MIAQQSWKQLSSIQIGGVICLPVIVIGQTLSQSYGFASAVLAIMLGNLALTLLGFVMASMSWREKKTTIENASLYFGKQGSLLISWAMLLSLLGWFGIQLDLMSRALMDLLSISSNRPYIILANIGLGVTMTCVGMYGMRALNLLSDFSMPVLGITLLYALCMPADGSPASVDAVNLGGVSLVIATAIVAVIDLPTYYRHARSKKDAYISILLTFGIVMPMIELIGVYLAASRAGETVIDVLKGSNPLWNIWVALFVVLAGWTTNNTNLYSGAVNLRFIWSEATPPQCTWVVGILGTFLACFNLLDHLESVLGVFGVAIGSMGAVIIAGYLMSRLKQIQWDSAYKANLAAWFLGTSIGLASLAGWYSVTSIAMLDAFLAASCGVILFLIIKQRNLYAANST